MDAELLAEVRRMTAPEEGPLATARERAADADPVPTPEVGTLLAWTARTVGARHAVEIGSAGGVSGLWLLRGMDGRGALTSIEADATLYGLAGRAFAEAEVTEHVRAIPGDPTEVLPRLSDDGYEVCVVQGRLTEYAVYLEHAVRLLRPGGVVLARGVLHDPNTGRGAALRAVADLLTAEPTLAGTVLPVDDGVAMITLPDAS